MVQSSLVEQVDVSDQPALQLAGRSELVPNLLGTKQTSSTRTYVWIPKSLNYSYRNSDLSHSLTWRAHSEERGYLDKGRKVLGIFIDTQAKL